MSTPFLKTIRLYGKLGAKYGREFKLAVKSTAEAVQALCTLLPGFEADLMHSKDSGIAYACFIGKMNITENQLHAPVGFDQIRIAPVISGSKKAGWLNVIVGLVLVVAGAVYGVYSGDWVTASQIIIAGIGMVAGGVVQLLSPQPKMGKPKEAPENDPNKYFSGPVNTQAQGQPFPILLGRLIIGSAVMSAGIEAKDNAYVPTNPPTGPSIGTVGGGGSAPWHLEWMNS